MNKKQKTRLLRIGVSGVMLALLIALPHVGIPIERWWLALCALPFLTAGYDVLWKAARNLVRGEVFDENFLMSIASLGAFALGEAREACAVMLFYQIGEFCQSLAVGRARRSIAALMAIRPDVATVERDGAWLSCAPEEVRPDEIILIRAGEKVPLDGVILDGESALDTAALTGESLPRDVRAGDAIPSGCINLTGTLRVRVTKPFAESTVSKILALVEESSAKKATTESFVTRFAKRYTPAVVLAAALLLLIPSSITGEWSVWTYRALTFLVISCPCALVISVPLGFFGGIGGASRLGILIKGGTDLEALARCKTVVFDKTGTLTEGTFRVRDIRPEGIDDDALLEVVALAEAYSTHPIARSVRERYGKDIDQHRVTDCREVTGKGVLACIDGRRVAVGNRDLMASEGLVPPALTESGTQIFVAIDGAYRGALLIRDEPKPDAKAAVHRLEEAGVQNIVMLTGDGESVAQMVADEVGIREVHANLLPADKVKKVESLLAAPHMCTLAFVGDGINDAPVLMRADVGIAMGALGSDAAIEAADVVLMDDKPTKIATAILLAKRTLRIVRANIVFALAVKALVLLLGAIGIADMWAAVFADVGVSLLCIVNSMRALDTRAF